MSLKRKSNDKVAASKGAANKAHQTKMECWARPRIDRDSYLEHLFFIKTERDIARLKEGGRCFSPICFI
jgi:hypothetical protein